MPDSSRSLTGFTWGGVLPDEGLKTETSLAYGHCLLCTCQEDKKLKACMSLYSLDLQVKGTTWSQLNVSKQDCSTSVTWASEDNSVKNNTWVTASILTLLNESSRPDERVLKLLVLKGKKSNNNYFSYGVIQLQESLISVRPDMIKDTSGSRLYQDVQTGININKINIMSSLNLHQDSH